MLTNTIFYGGLFLFWLGLTFLTGLAGSTTVAGVILVAAGAVRYVVEKMDK